MPVAVGQNPVRAADLGGTETSMNSGISQMTPMAIFEEKLIFSGVTYYSDEGPYGIQAHRDIFFYYYK